MSKKDYYNILQIDPSSSIEEIKRAYRKLAMEFHPDRNLNNSESTAWFREIQEAYSVLSDPIQRERYHRERWLSKTPNQQYTPPKPSTPLQFMQKVLELERFVYTHDKYRLDKIGLLAYLENLLSDETIDLLLKNEDEQMNSKIFQLLLAAASPLNYKQIQSITDPLTQLAERDATSKRELERFIQTKKNEFLFDKYKVLITILIAIAICVFIFRMAE